MLDFFATSFDLPILEWIQENVANGFLDFLMPIITIFGDAGIFWIACAAVMLIFPKTRKTGLAMGVALVMGLLVCNICLKPLVARMRPLVYEVEILGNSAADLLHSGQLLVGKPSDVSFPSGHTIASFEAAGVLMLNNKKLGIPALVLAILIAFSRMYLFVHYPTDVLVSVVLGTLFAILANYLVNKGADKLEARRAQA